jgi:hypothetical protein
MLEGSVGQGGECRSKTSTFAKLQDKFKTTAIKYGEQTYD